MNHKDKKSGIEVDINEDVREAFEKMRTDRGECPAPEQLVKFQQRSLTAEEIIIVKRHIEDCGSCDWIVRGLTEFDAASLRDQEKSAGWAAKVQHLLFHPALAYLLVLALLYPAYRGIFHKPNIVEKTIPVSKPLPVEGVGSARDFNLGDGSTQRAALPLSEEIIQLSKDDKFFILNFFIPVRADHRYEMQITNEKGNVIATDEAKSRDQLGNFSVVCTRQLFPAGSYILRIKELDLQGNLHDEYVFRFKMLPPL